MTKMIKCVSCGADYDAALRRCPYCGTATLEADEKEYMDTLEDVRKDLEEYGSEGSKELKRGLSKTVLIMIVILIAAAILIGGSIWLTGVSSRNDSQRKKEEFLTNQGITSGMIEETIYEV